MIDLWRSPNLASICRLLCSVFAFTASSRQTVGAWARSRAQFELGSPEFCTLSRICCAASRAGSAARAQLSNKLSQPRPRPQSCHRTWASLTCVSMSFLVAGPAPLSAGVKSTSAPGRGAEGVLGALPPCVDLDPPLQRKGRSGGSAGRALDSAGGRRWSWGGAGGGRKGLGHREVFLAILAGMLG